MSQHTATAKKHHAAAGRALERGDHTGAMHHVGHLFQACKQCAREDAAAEAVGMGDDEREEEVADAPAKMGIRERMAALRVGAQSDG